MLHGGAAADSRVASQALAHEKGALHQEVAGLGLKLSGGNVQDHTRVKDLQEDVALWKARAEEAAALAASLTGGSLDGMTGPGEQEKLLLDDKVAEQQAELNKAAEEVQLWKARAEAALELLETFSDSVVQDAQVNNADTGLLSPLRSELQGRLAQLDVTFQENKLLQDDKA